MGAGYAFEKVADVVLTKNGKPAIWVDGEARQVYDERGLTTKPTFINEESQTQKYLYCLGRGMFVVDVQRDSSGVPENVEVGRVAGFKEGKAVIRKFYGINVSTSDEWGKVPEALESVVSSILEL